MLAQTSAVTSNLPACLNLFNPSVGKVMYQGENIAKIMREMLNDIVMYQCKNNVEIKNNVCVLEIVGRKL